MNSSVSGWAFAVERTVGASGWLRGGVADVASATPGMQSVASGRGLGIRAALSANSDNSLSGSRIWGRGRIPQGLHCPAQITLEKVALDIGVEKRVNLRTTVYPPEGDNRPLQEWGPGF